MEKFERYVVGSKIIPDWVNNDSKTGKIKFNFEDGQLIDVTISIQNKVVKAFTGDIIVKSKNGFNIIKPQPKKVSKEVNNEE